MKVINLVSKVAKQNAKIKEYKQEWVLEFSLLIFTKIMISAISIITGYTYLFNLSYPFLDSFTVPVTITLLIIIELFTALLLAKFSKHLLRGRYLNSVLLFPVVCLIFFVSFHLSTNGIAQLTSSKTSNITAISDQYNTNRGNVNRSYSNEIKELQNQISTIKANPTNWSGGKRSVLSSEQLKQMTNFQNQITGLRQQQRKELHELKTAFDLDKQNDLHTVTNKADNYYKIVSAILIIQLFLSFVISYMSKAIYKKDETESFVMQDIQAFQSDMMERAKGVILQQSKILSNRVLQAFELANIIHENDLPIVETKTKQIGFQVATKQRTTDQVPEEPESDGGDNPGHVTQKEVMNEPALKVNNPESSTLNVDDNQPPHNKVCKYCGISFYAKHWNAQYCCSNHKIKAWEQRTGGKVKFGKKA